MAVSLTKGGNVSLTKEAGATGLTSVTIGLGWKPRTTTGTDFDLDGSAILLDGNNKAVAVGNGTTDQSLVYFNNLTSADGSVRHTGDNLTGEGEGDDEQIKIDLKAVPAEVEKIVFPVAIYDAANRGNQNFGQVAGAFVRIVNDADGSELARYDLTEDAATGDAMVFGELYRHAGAGGAEWKFRAIGQEYASGLPGIASEYGVTV